MMDVDKTYFKFHSNLIKAYQYFYGAVLHYPSYTFKPNSRQQAMIVKFLALLDKSYKINTLGTDFLFRYFAFQFQCREEQSTRFEGRVMLNWTIGPKALERWKKKDPSYYFFCTEGILKRYEIGLKKVFPDTQEKKFYLTGLTFSEEIEKRRFLNTNDGFANCIDNTTLYNKESPVCEKCQFATECKALLIQVLPHTAKAREFV